MRKPVFGFVTRQDSNRLARVTEIIYTCTIYIANKDADQNVLMLRLFCVFVVHI